MLSFFPRTPYSCAFSLAINSAGVEELDVARCSLHGLGGRGPVCARRTILVGWRFFRTDGGSRDERARGEGTRFRRPKVFGTIGSIALDSSEARCKGEGYRRQYNGPGGVGAPAAEAC